MWETPKAKVIAKELEKGEINGEKANALEEKIIIMQDRNNTCETINDSLKVEIVKANEIIKNQDTIIKNDNKINSEQQDIITKNNDMLAKSEKKIKKKNGTIKTLIITNVVTAAIVVLFIISGSL